MDSPFWRMFDSTPSLELYFYHNNLPALTSEYNHKLAIVTDTFLAQSTVTSLLAGDCSLLRLAIAFYSQSSQRGEVKKKQKLKQNKLISLNWVYTTPLICLTQFCAEFWLYLLFFSLNLTVLHALASRLCLCSFCRLSVRPFTPSSRQAFAQVLLAAAFLDSST